MHVWSCPWCHFELAEAYSKSTTFGTTVYAFLISISIRTDRTHAVLWQGRARSMCICGQQTLLWSFYKMNQQSLEIENRQFDDFVAIVGTVGFRNDNLQCHEWRQALGTRNINGSTQAEKKIWNYILTWFFRFTMAPNILIEIQIVQNFHRK